MTPIEPMIAIQQCNDALLTALNGRDIGYAIVIVTCLIGVAVVAWAAGFTSGRHSDHES